jgi:hypothetical protein
MSFRKLLSTFFLSALMLVGIASLHAQETQGTPEAYQKVMEVLGRRGDYSANVLKVGVPRNDLAVSIEGRPVLTGLGFNGWIGLTRGDEGLDVLMGDLVLRQEEVNAVIGALLDNGLEVTALHNHFFWEEPRIFFMHIYGRGPTVELARRVKPALDLIAAAAAGQKKGSAQEAPAVSQLDGDQLAHIIGHAGAQSDSVYKITVGRDDFVLKVRGAVINARMGLNSWAAFAGSDKDAVVAGDVAMRASEVTQVLEALRVNGLKVVAVHHHMLATDPMIYFLHYYGRGPAAQLARGFRAALDELGKK